MMIRFFEKLNTVYYINYAYVTNKFINNKKKTESERLSLGSTQLSQSHFKDWQSGKSLCEIINTYNSIKKLRPRTFGINANNSKNKQNQLRVETLIFDDLIKCSKCKKNIEIGLVTLNFNEMNKVEQLKCPECYNLFSPKINVQYGKKVEHIILYNAYHLYKLSNGLVKQYGNKIDLDDLRNKYKDFFFNCIWYFGLKGISYEMMLKYININNCSIKKGFNNLKCQKQYE